MRLLLLLSLLLANVARAEVDTVVTGYQHGLTYLPLMVMQDQHLVEKQAKARGLAKLATEWRIFGGPAAINDGLLAGSVHFGGVGVPSLVSLWTKTRKNLGIKAVGALAAMPMYLNTNNPAVKTLKDFSPKDKIAVPSIKIGIQAVTLQMAAAQAFGKTRFDALDPLTVGMSHPDAFVALLAGQTQIAAHFASPPFQTEELEKGKGKVHTVLKSYDVLGGPATFTLVVAADKFRVANPKVFEAYVAALGEASDYINKDKAGAAALYKRVTGAKESEAELQKLLADPENIFDLTPRQLGKYAAFMHDTGTVKETAASWKDLAHPHLQTLPGS